MSEPAKSKIFISYRREDSRATTQRIYERLVARFGLDAIFKDVDTIPYGVDFARFIAGYLHQCAVQLVVIGPAWLDMRRADGTRRLDNPRDFVRQEIEGALALNLTIIPVLVQGAGMPHTSRLPESLRGMLRYNGLPLREGPDFESDLGRVLRAVESWLAGRVPEAAGATDVVLQLLAQLTQASTAQDWPQVVRIADLLIRTRPDAASAETYRMLGIAALALGEPQRARAALEEALRREPLHVPTMRAAAKACLQLGQPAEAAHLLRDALALVSDPAEQLAMLAEYAAMLAAFNQWEELVRTSEEALRLAPADQAYWRKLKAQALVHLGRMREAAEAARGLLPVEYFPARLEQLAFLPLKVDGVEVILPPVVPVSKGEFLMGSDIRHDAQAFDDELPQHSVMLPAFQIAKFPVTVVEYACFVRAGHAQPQHWQSQLSKPDHPVVSVSWRDAVAYAAWLAELTRLPWRLPTEAEWEKAARGTDGRLYPWGNTWDNSRASTSESGIRTTLPVGQFPNGASPCGALDMAGNVWEWTSSLFQPYPYNQDDGREDPNATGSHVLRGGPWPDIPWFARAAFRYTDDPGDLGGVGLGFRLLLAAPGP